MAWVAVTNFGLAVLGLVLWGGAALRHRTWSLLAFVAIEALLVVRSWTVWMRIQSQAGPMVLWLDAVIVPLAIRLLLIVGAVVFWRRMERWAREKHR